MSEDRAALLFLESFAELAEQQGIETGVTLIVAGTVVAGTLTRVRAFGEWMFTTFHHGKAPEPSTEVPQPQGSKVDALRLLCLRDAVINPGTPHLLETPFLLVPLASVAAYALGQPNR